MCTLEIQEHVALAPFTTMGVGGAARFFVHVRSERQIEEGIAFRDQNRLPLAILGGGSNLLVHDEGFPGVVLHLDLKGEVRFTHEGDWVQCVVPAGTPWDHFVFEACQRNLSGVECLAGIPGLTGGTPVQNVGAYGQEVSQTIATVRAFDLHTRSFVEIAAPDCQFGYRSSRFNSAQPGRFLVTSVRFRLRNSGRPVLTYAELRDRFAGESPTPIQVYRAVRQLRSGKGMLLSDGDPDSRSAGSFFKNPVVSEDTFLALSSKIAASSGIPHWDAPPGSFGERCVKLAAAWLVQEAGFTKGFVQGRAGISSKHALALVNRGGATFADIAHLRDRIQQTVADRFGISLVQEPVELGPGSVTVPLPAQD